MTRATTKQWLALGCITVFTFHVSLGLSRPRPSLLWRAEVSVMEQTVRGLVTATRSEVENENPPHREIREEGSDDVQLVAEGGDNIHVAFWLSYDQPEKTDYIVNPRLVKIIAPLTMKDLTVEFREISLTRDSQVTYNGSLVMRFARDMTLTMEILVNRHLTSCSKGVYYAETAGFDYDPTMVHPRSDPFRDTPDVKHKFLEAVRRMTDRYSFYILRNTFTNMGPAFGEDLCTIG